MLKLQWTVQDEIEAAEIPKAKPTPKNLVSGGLTHLTVASDLAFVDFNQSDEEGAAKEQEYRATPWNKKINPDVGACHAHDLSMADYVV